MLSDEQLAARVHTIGASDVPAVLGIHPWRSPIDVWLKKAPLGEKPPVTVEQVDTEATEMGNDFEEVVLRRLSTQYGLTMMRDRATRAHPENQRLTATPDAIAAPNSRAVETVDGVLVINGTDVAVAEAKLVGAFPAKHWTDPETKEPVLPDYVYAQNVWQMGVCGVRTGLIGAQVASTTWRHFRREFDADLFDSMREQVERFLVDHVDKRVPPPRAADEDRIEYLKKRFPRSDGTLELVDELPPALAELSREYVRLGEKIKDWEAEQEACKAEIIELIAGLDGYKGPWGTLTNKSQRGRAQYKRIAEFLAGGEIREDVLNRFRGEDFRQLRCNLK